MEFEITRVDCIYTTYLQTKRHKHMEIIYLFIYLLFTFSFHVIYLFVDLISQQGILKCVFNVQTINSHLYDIDKVALKSSMRSKKKCR